MLHGTLALHDIKDTEAFCWQLIHDAKLKLNNDDNEDLAAYLISEAWILSTRYTAGGITFSTYARNTLQRRIIDWKRKRYGRTKWTNPNGNNGTTYIRERPILHSLDTGANGGARRAGRTLTTPFRDPAEHRDPRDLVRLLRERSSDEAWRNHRNNPKRTRRTT